tara:strand:- start:295 stop:486 length:192 start_codon:yes stop_codon:yes gene_type:complete
MNNQNEPTFALFFQLTTKAGSVTKEVLAKRWQVLPTWKKTELYNKALSDKPKKSPEEYLNRGR